MLFPTVGWWLGVSEEAKCPYGLIIHISAEHERYLARSYSRWQLATAKSRTPIFEIYITTGLEGEYKEQISVESSWSFEDFKIAVNTLISLQYLISIYRFQCLSYVIFIFLGCK